MTLTARILEALQQVGLDIKGLHTKIGGLGSLNTTLKTDIVSAINEVLDSDRTTTATNGVAVGADNTLAVNHTGSSTAVSYAHRSQLNYVTNGDILTGGWLSAYGAMVNVTGSGDVDKIVANFSQTHLSNDGVIKASLGYEAVLSTVGANTDVKAWAAFYVPTMRAVPNIDTVDVLGAFVNEDPKAVSWTQGSFYNSTKQEFAPPSHTGIIPGRAYSAPFQSIAESQLNPNIFYLVPVNIPHRTDITNMGVRVTTAGAGGTKLRLGIYGNISGKVSGKKYGSDEIAADVIGVKEVTIAGVTLDAGLHWLVVECNAACGIDWHLGDVGQRASMYGQSSAALDAKQTEYLAYINAPYSAFPDVVDVNPTFANFAGEPHIWYKGSAATGFGAMGSPPIEGGGSGVGITFHEASLDFGQGGGKAVMKAVSTISLPGALVAQRVVASVSLLLGDNSDGSDDLELDPIIAYGMVTAPDVVKICALSLDGPIYGIRKVIFVVG